MSPSEQSNCVTCGAELMQPRTGRKRRYCSDYCRRMQYAGTCIDCGGPTTWANSRGNVPIRCGVCDARVTPDRNREMWAGYRQMIEGMWAEGMTGRAIGEAIGHPVNISSLRARGYNLPHRNRVGPLELRLANLARARQKLAEHRS